MPETVLNDAPARTATVPVPLQPLLSGETVVLAAPVQAWSAADATMGSAAIHGIWVGDTRVVSALATAVRGSAVETISSAVRGAGRLQVEGLLRGLDDPGADPDVRISRRRTVDPRGCSEELSVTSRRREEFRTTVEVRLRADASSMELVKAGLGATPPAHVDVAGDGLRWNGGGAENHLRAPGADVTVDGVDVTLAWSLPVPAGGTVTVGWRLDTDLPEAVVHAARGPASWSTAGLRSGDDRLDRWAARALDDLAALRMTVPDRPEDVFLAAGAPWFFTLFGRDSIWAARLLLPVDHAVAAGTLRILADRQGTRSVAGTAEQPGKIMHELRREPLSIPGEGVTLAPLYYGTIDATPLWICLLHDAWRAGMADVEVAELLPNLERALTWMVEFGDSDGDGFLEYVDETGHGLANQGWKDSGDSVQFRDGRFADGPIALCEVQAYAHEAALKAADLLEHFGRPGADRCREEAARLRSAFRNSFWVEDEEGPYPAIALDVHKNPVNSLTSNIGHLLGTGLLDREEEERVAARLVSSAMSSGFGVRTMSTTDRGYWPLSYHRGSVWTHDTAIAIAGLLRSGFAAEARQLAEGLLAAAVGFGFRMPELHSGDAAEEVGRPVPYPAACHPQAWSAAAVVPVWTALAGAWPLTPPGPARS
ncbi:glycogen debranching N-terminal domain-containing protein [Kineococcus gynurae]|uniref:Glycogen debranching N-terminal domain-containing protein n=1 Tax=Kineococcus gynurae TaxID=452979 RepID=A0ABV5LRS3_9ACTN